MNIFSLYEDYIILHSFKSISTILGVTNHRMALPLHLFKTPPRCAVEEWLAALISCASGFRTRQPPHGRLAARIHAPNKTVKTNGKTWTRRKSQTYIIGRFWIPLGLENPKSMSPCYHFNIFFGVLLLKNMQNSHKIPYHRKLIRSLRLVQIQGSQSRSPHGCNGP